MTLTLSVKPKSKKEKVRIGKREYRIEKITKLPSKEWVVEIRAK